MRTKTKYYACLERKDGIILKMPFENREDARKYIELNYDEFIHKSRWTE